MKTWKKIYAAVNFVCVAAATVCVWSNIEDFSLWVLILVLVWSIFATYIGIDGLKED